MAGEFTSVPALSSRVAAALLIAIADSGAAQAQAETAPTPTRIRCAAPEFHLLDYLIGDWEVIETSNGAHFLYNKIEPINGGCALRENLVMQGDTPGTSMTFLSRKEGRWHQFYHSPGRHAHLEGTTTPEGVNELHTKAELPGTPGEQFVRQVTSRDEKGRPRQIGYARPRLDAEWRVLWDITFCSRNPGARIEPPCSNVKN